MTLRSILALSFTIEQLGQRYGMDTDALLARHGLSRAHLNASATISQADELAILEDIAQQLADDPLAALNVSRTFGLSSYGAFAMMLMSCSSVYEAMTLGIKYQQLGYLFSELALKLSGDHAELRLIPFHLPQALHRFVMDRDVAGTYHFLNTMQTMLGQQMKPLLIRMPYPEPAEAAAYREAFACPVEFGASEASFVLPLATLRIPFPAGNSTALALYQQQCDELLNQRKQTGNGRLGERLQRYLSMFSQQYPGVKESAAIFGLSERQLRRVLSAEGEGFQAILDRVRSQRACHLLARSATSIEQIALQMGYSEAAGFIHAFRKWHGCTPAAYRRNQSSSGSIQSSSAPSTIHSSSASSAEKS